MKDCQFGVSPVNYSDSDKQVGETHERTEYLSKDRISVEGQIQLSVKRQIYHFFNQIYSFYFDCKQNRKLSEPLHISRKVL